MRRQKLSPELADEDQRRKIIIDRTHGPLAKTEIARRLAKLTKLSLSQSRSLEVTEVGYVGAMWSPSSATS